jgi:hypothetical protein
MSSTQLQQANGKSKKDNCTALPDAGKQGTTPAETIVQTLPQRSNGRCYFLHPTEYRIRTHRLTASPTNPQHVRVEGRYTGEWTIDCEKHHVHTKSCKPQHATGFGRLTYEIAGRKFVEEGHFHRGLLDTGSDSSDSEVDYDAADEEEDEPYVSAPAASSSKPSEDKEKKGDDDEKKETASDVAVTTSGAGERAGVSKKRPHSPAADDTKAKKTKKSSGAPASKPKVEKAKAADDSTPFQDRSSAASKSAKLREAAASSSACVFKRYDPPASSTASAQHRRPHSISVQDALQYEAAASKAAEARANGKRSKVPWGRDGWTYRGAMKGDKRHGFGTCTYDTGSVFQGEYVNDRSSGFGVWRDWINDVRLEYEGGWLEDQEHGVGKLTTINSDIGKFTAKGTWNHGEMEGEGTWTLASGHVYYKGLFHHGNFSRGLLHSIDPPRRYEGEFLNQQFSGHGCMQWTNNSSGDSPEGSVYLYGTFVRHDPFGPGIIITTHCPSSSAGSERFQIFPAVYKGEMVYARWIRKEGVEGKKKDEAEQESKMDTSEEVAAAAPSAEQDDDSAVVWDYLRQLISDGLEAVNRMQANPLSDADIQHVIDEKLSSYISSSDFHLISLPNSIFNGERQGVCAYKISDQVGCANQPYICHTCSKGRKVPLEVCAVSLHRPRSVSKCKRILS